VAYVVLSPEKDYGYVFGLFPAKDVVMHPVENFGRPCHVLPVKLFDFQPFRLMPKREAKKEAKLE
jgi:hypothetical protein